MKPKLEIVTIEDLKRLNACDPGLEWAKTIIPKEGMPAEELFEKIERADWLIWSLWNLGHSTKEQIVMAGACVGRLAFKFARPEDEDVLEAALDAADKVAENNTKENRDAACAAARAASAAADAAYAAAGPADAAADAAYAAAGPADVAADVAASAARAAMAACAAADAARAAWAAVVGHPDCTNAIRRLMKTKRWAKAGKGGE